MIPLFTCHAFWSSDSALPVFSTQNIITGTDELHDLRLFYETFINFRFYLLKKKKNPKKLFLIKLFKSSKQNLSTTKVQPPLLKTLATFLILAMVTVAL